MATRTFKVYYPNQTVVDPLGSIIVNTNTTISPNYQWVVVNNVYSTGTPDTTRMLGDDLGLKDTVSYKIKFLEVIPRHNNLLSNIGNSACLTNPGSVACMGRGPYIIFNQRYYIDFFVLYFVNTSVIPTGENPADYIITSPIFSVDTSRNAPDYGIFIATPKINPTLSPYLTAEIGTTEDKMFIGSLPEYSNDIGLFNTSITYLCTPVNSSLNPIETTLSVGNIINLVENNINNGQTSIVSIDKNNNPIVLQAQTSASPPTFAPQSYYPFILFRYVSENATTRKLSLNFSFAANI